MLNLLYFLLFSAVSIFLFIVILVLLLVFGFFSQSKESKENISILDFLLNKVKNSNGDKEILDSTMKEFYANYYNIHKESEQFDTWLSLIQAITMFDDYMSVEQVANFRDDLVAKNPSIKKDIEYSIGESLKYRETSKNKR
ncbi:MAG: hypothetical protein K2P17_05625 [Helicobacteraceae bacterium]|nr:hypothetical protein [Helicobacteraceae bacterium]